MTTTASAEMTLTPLAGETIEDFAERAAAQCGDIDDLLAMLQGADGFGVTESSENEVAGDADESEEPGGRLMSLLERAQGDLARAKELANWLLGKRAKEQQRIAEINTFADQQVAVANAWRKVQTGRAEHKLAWMGNLLRNFLIESGLRKVELPRGTVGFARARKEIAWNEDEATGWVVSRMFEAFDGGKMEKVQDLIGVLTIKKSAVKELLKPDKGGYEFRDENGEAVGFVRNAEKGEVPPGPGMEEKPEWAVPGETYELKIG